jgi:hypothetical protein
MADLVPDAVWIVTSDIDGEVTNLAAEAPVFAVSNVTVPLVMSSEATVGGQGPIGPPGPPGSPSTVPGPPGPPGPSTISTNANNKATLGTDSFILVQGTAAGIAATSHAQTVSGDDPQLTNARTPTAHKSSHITGGADIIPTVTSSAVGLCPVTPNDATKVLRGDGAFGTLAYSSLGSIPSTFAPSAHGSTHAGSGADPVPIATTTVAGLVPAKPNTGVNATTSQVVMGDDTRLSNSRAPTAHASTHNLGGSDAIAPDWTQVANKPTSFAPTAHASSHLDNGTDPVSVVTATRTGLAPKLNGNAATFLNGTGAYTTPAGGGDMLKSVYDTANNGIVDKAEALTNLALTTTMVGDAQITGAKIAGGTITNTNLAAGVAVANIGYTPINKGGDSMTGGHAWSGGGQITIQNETGLSSSSWNTSRLYIYCNGTGARPGIGFNSSGQGSACYLYYDGGQFRFIDSGGTVHIISST